MHKYLFNFFRVNNVITAFQSGFVPGDSTVNQLIDIYIKFCKALDEGMIVRAIFHHISKAFLNRAIGIINFAKHFQNFINDTLI